MVSSVIIVLGGHVRKRRAGYRAWVSFRRDWDMDNPYNCAKALAKNRMGVADVAAV